MSKDLITDIINHFSSNKIISGKNMIPIIKRVMNQGTLLFSTSTTQLFDGIVKPLADKSGEDVEMNFNFLYGGRHESEHKKSKANDKTIALS